MSLKSYPFIGTHLKNKLIKMANMADQNQQNALPIIPVCMVGTGQVHFKHTAIHYFEYEIKTN